MLCPRGLAATAAIVFLFLTGPGAKAAEPSARAVEWGMVNLEMILRGAKDVEAARRNATEQFAKWDPDGDGIGENDRLRQRNARLAQTRTNSLRLWLARDLDGDGAVTRAELEKFFIVEVMRTLNRGRSAATAGNLQEHARLKRDEKVAEALEADANGDGVVTIAEIYAMADERQPVQLRPGQAMPPAFLDADGDGVVSEAEFMAVVDAVLERADPTGDGNLSAEETRQFRREAMELKAKVDEAERAARDLQHAEAMRDICAFPKPPEGARVIQIRAGGGAGLASVSLGKKGTVVSVGDIRIGPGEEPIYLLLYSSRPMVWRLTGVTDRVVQVVTGNAAENKAGAELAGVIGIPEDRFFVPGKADCIKLVNGFTRAKAEHAARITEALLGQSAVATVVPTLHTVLLPLGIFDNTGHLPGAIETPADGPSAFLWRAVALDHPGGIVQLDPNEIVSRGAVIPRESLPGLAGLAQLVDSGAIDIVETNRAVRMGGGQNIVYAVPRTIYVHKQIRVPDGLSASSYTFELPPGVPEPENLPSRAKVVRHER